ncbi:MAG: aldehyde dehydrogenase family protein [Betaproteobacteria bacterium]
MKMTSDDPMVIPLWISGHAYLTMTERYHDIGQKQGGAALRRVPCCGRGQVETALAAAEEAQPDWAALTLGERQGFLLALADALESYTDHFSRLLQEEAGLAETDARAEVEAALAFLRAGCVGDTGVVGFVVAEARPLASFAETLAPTLLAGGAVVGRSALRSPGAAFALCELSARAKWPEGVLNLVHGDAAADAAFAAAAKDGRMVFQPADNAGEAA